MLIKTMQSRKYYIFHDFGDHVSCPENKVELSFFQSKTKKYPKKDLLIHHF